MAEEVWSMVPCLSRTAWNSREPTIGVTSDGTIWLYPAMTGHNAQPTGVAASRDRGSTWDLVLPALAGIPTHMVSTDPYMHIDTTTDRIFADDLAGSYCSVLSWSDDLGGSWDHSYSGCLEEDHQTVFTGSPTVSETTGYPNVVYRCAMNLVTLGAASTTTTCQRSLDGGRVWLPFDTPPFTTRAHVMPAVCNGATGHGVTDRAGTVYLPRGWCGEPWLAMSRDEGRSWTRVRTSSLGVHGHDAAVGADPNGNLLYFWLADDRLPRLVASRDGGATWGKPVPLAPPGLVAAGLPDAVVAGPETMAWVYYGTSDPDEMAWHAYLGYTSDALAAVPTIVTAVLNHPDEPMIVGPCCGGAQDFIDVQLGADGTAWGAFVDDCLGPGLECQDPFEPLDTHRVAAAGWIAGAPDLWQAVPPS